MLYNRELHFYSFSSFILVKSRRGSDRWRHNKFWFIKIFAMRPLGNRKHVSTLRLILGKHTLNLGTTWNWLRIVSSDGV